MVFQEVAKKFQGSFKSVQRTCKGYFKKVSRKIEIVGYFDGDFSGFQGYSKRTSK